ncbi:MAG: phosphoribosylanthranilate isomerase [Verrucomicrobiota bacterium]|nr:phosphoribosylanthranilate isomerase [Verrucomicrobiota bacterium]
MFLTNLKICGITSPDTARFCAEAGAGALGVVFFDKSPRRVTPRQARAIFDGLPERIARVGVFVNRPRAECIRMAREAGLDTVQLHGDESADDIAAAQDAGFRVIKVLRAAGEKLLETAERVSETAGILIECGTGTLPGGNGAAWDWAAAAPLAAVRPFGVAGGLNARNIAQAARLSGAAAWDVSSGVETAPGVKDPAAIAELARCVCAWAPAADAFWSAPGRRTND